MKFLTIFLVIILTFPTVFGEDHFLNLREGESRFIGKNEKLRVRAIFGKYGKGFLKDHFTEVFQDREIATCASEVVKKLRDFEIEESGRESLAFAIRSLNIIDDIALDVILKRNKIGHKLGIPSLNRSSVDDDKIRKGFSDYKRNLKEGLCPEDAYRNLVRSLNKVGYVKNSNLKAANAIAKRKKIISKSVFRNLESFRKSDVHEWGVTLNSYSQKLKALRRQIDLYGHEEGDFVTKENKKAKMSLRQYLYSNYNYMQILMMGNLVKKMRMRLNSMDISILIRYADDEQTEVIPLEPMERFRFVLKLVRKELSQMNSSNIFEKSKGHYGALITASYEIGVVPAIELEELSSLEEIWNPKKTKTDRIMIWGRMFSSVASVVIPGPFGFLPILAVMIVDGIVAKPIPNGDQDISLF